MVYIDALAARVEESAIALCLGNFVVPIVRGKVGLEYRRVALA